MGWAGVVVGFGRWDGNGDEGIENDLAILRPISLGAVLAAFLFVVKLYAPPGHAAKAIIAASQVPAKRGSASSACSTGSITLTK